MLDNARKIVAKALPGQLTDEIWAYQYKLVFPVLFLGFELSAVLPAVFFMFRFGFRRGSGNFLKTFAVKEGSLQQRRKSATIVQVAGQLAKEENIVNFDDDVKKAILGDLLLAFNVENANHAVGRDKQLQRVAPAHYMASWVDLPTSIAWLRSVPEMIVAMLANQEGEYVDRTKEDKKTWFPVARTLQDNLLLEPFSQGVEREGRISDRKSDKFNEESQLVGVDQLLVIRLSQMLKEAPEKNRGKDGAKISNQRPISAKAAEAFSADMRRFIRAYRNKIPRQTFVDTIESCVSIGMTTALTSAIVLLVGWQSTGKIVEKHEQKPADLFVDCSSGVNAKLRDQAERSFDDLTRKIDRIPAIFMCLRILDFEARYNPEVKKMNIPTGPYATKWLNLLGSILHDDHSSAKLILGKVDGYVTQLAEGFADDYVEVADALNNEYGEPNPVKRLATALTILLGGSVRSKTFEMVDSMMNIRRSNGLACKRKTTRGTQIAGGRRRQRDARSLVLSDSTLDYLVHLLLLKVGNKVGVRRLSFSAFLLELRSRYGFHVDVAPNGMSISSELLRSNRSTLERRLRDLGLLVGVNDAESMKLLRGRFTPEKGNTNASQ